MKIHAEIKKCFTLLKTVLPLLLIAVSITGCQVGTKTGTNGAATLHDAKPAFEAVPGKMAPQFSLRTFSTSKVISLTDLLGQKPILINVFASWCNPCDIEAPFLEQGYKALSSQITFIGVNATSQELNVQAPIAFIKKNQISFPILQDTDGTFLNRYAVMGLPTTYLVNPDGTVEHVKVGAFRSLKELVSFVHSPK